MSVAFVKEESAETAAETLLPDRPISPHPNLVTEAGLEQLKRQLEKRERPTRLPAQSTTSTKEDDRLPDRCVTCAI